MTKTKIDWWQLSIEGDTELEDSDREHIAEMIKQGFTSGQIVQEIEED